MGIPRLRVERALDRARDSLMSRGLPITMDRLRENLRDFGSPDRPQMEVAYQKRKSPFNLDAHNNMLWQSREDFWILFTEFYLQSMRSLRVVDRGDTVLRHIVHNGKVLNDLLEHELLRVKDASGYFLGVFDEFRDLCNIDHSNTTAVVDLGTESVRLLRNEGSSYRVNLSHLLGTVQAPVVVENSQLESRSDRAGHLISSTTMVGAPFGNCFDSLHSGWQHEIVSRSQDGVTVELTFDVSPNGQAIPITSVVINPLLTSARVDKVLYSEDGSGYTPISTFTLRPIDITKLRISGFLNNVAKLRIVITVENPSSEIIVEELPAFVYYIALKEIELYKEGFATEGILTSILMSPSEENGFTTIDKVSLRVNSELPVGTDITYEIAPSTDPTNFRKIAPLGTTVLGATNVVDFDQIAEVFAQDNKVEVIAAPTDAVKNGIVLRNIYTFSSTPQFMKTTIRRGIDAWRLLSRKGPKEEFIERGNLINFLGDDSPKSLYVSVKGEEITNLPESVPSTQTTVATMYTVLQDSNSVPAPTNILISNAQNPNYIVGRAILRPYPNRPPDTGIYTITSTDIKVYVGTAATGTEGEKFVMISGDTFWTLFPVGASDKQLRRAKDQVVTLSYTKASGQPMPTAGNPSSFSIKNIKKKSKKRLGKKKGYARFTLSDPFNKIEASKINTGVTLTFESMDVTEDIVETNDAGLVFDSDLTLIAEDVLIVDYRRNIQGEEIVLPNTVEVSSSIDNAVIYQVGRDYTFDIPTSTISKVPDGTIVGDTVRVTFSYQTRRLTHHTYETWVTVPTAGITDLTLKGFTTALRDGESATIATGDGEVSFDTKDPITLARGLYRITVVTNPVRINEDINNLTDTALYKTINMLDSDDSYVFGPGRYFERMEAFLSPMKEVSYFDLSYSIMKGDHTAFAVSGTKLLFNFDPTIQMESDVIMLPTNTTVPLPKEWMEVGYKYLPAISGPITGVVFRATLRLLPGEEPNKTPTLHGYDLRFAHGV